TALQLRALTASTLFPYTTLFRSDVREGHGQVGAPVLALRLVLLEHDRVEPFAALVHRVEAFAEADDVLVRLESQREPHEVHAVRSEEHTSELQSRENLVCSLLLE